MKRLRFLFIFFLLSFGLFIWRGLDFIAFIWPSPWLYSLIFTPFSLFFILWPIKLARPQIQARWIWTGLTVIWGLAYLSGPLSSMATKDPSYSHCGNITFTGFFYTLHSILPPAYQDDIDARNQLCWIRKMISRVPEKFDEEIEIETYSKLTTEKLLKPEQKYRVALPLVLYLWGKILSPFGRIQSGQQFIENLKTWSDLYQIEISERNYEWYESPYSNYIKFEYGLIEKNWEKIRIETQD